MNRLVVLVLAIGAIAIGATVWAVFPRKPKAVDDPRKYHFMHCPECLREQVYSARGLDTKCPECDKTLVPTEKSIKETGTGAAYKRMLVYVLAESVAILGALVYILYNPPPPKEMEQYYTRCPNRKCKRRMRYPASRAGMMAQCPRCKTTFCNPTVEEQELIEKSELMRNPDSDS